jgi:hypothetical protein
LNPAKLNKSVEGFQEVINHHVPYEVRMMRQTYAMLADGSACLWFSQTVINALIELLLTIPPRPNTSRRKAINLVPSMDRAGT